MQAPDPMETLRELIERAAKVVGSKTELARQLGVNPQRINDWRAGYRPCPPEIVAIMADIAGLPGEEWLARASLWYAKEKPYYDLLVRAVGKYAPPTTGAAASCSLVGALVLACTEAGKVLQCVLC
ncbi:MAG: helix-turn-helix domain-containing protein [Tepidimonas ignava]|nr:helix-turn-helix domain-containing protein [Tepidimonas ignava]